MADDPLSIPPPGQSKPWVGNNTAGTSQTDIPPPGASKPWVGTPALSDTDSVARAVGTGAIQGVPLGGDIASAGVPLIKNYVAPALEAVARPINRLFGIDTDADRQKASAALPSTYADAKARLKAATAQAAEEHPWIQTGSSLATGAMLMPGGIPGSLPRAVGTGAGVGALYGFGEGDSLEDRLRGAAWGAGFGSLGGAAGYGLGALTGRATGPVADAANRLDVPMPRYQMSNPLMQRVGTVSQSVPLVGEMTRKAAGHATTALADRVQGLGGNVTPERAGSAISDALNDWIGPRTQQLTNRLYTQASSQLDQNIRSPLTATGQLISSMGVLPKARGSELTGRAIDEVNKALAVPGGLSYDVIKDLRTTIDQLKGGWGSINPDPIDAARIARLHGALSQDLDAAAAAADRTGQGFAAHQTASRVYNAVSQERRALTPLVGKRGDNPAEQVFAGLARRASDNPSRADVDLLQRAKTAVLNSSTPEAWNTFEQGVINRLGVGKNGFTPDMFLNHYSGIDDAAKNVLFSPQNRAVLDDAATVAQKMKDAGFAKNPSGTSHGTMAAALTAGALEYGGHLLHHPFSTAAGLGSTYGAARFLNAPVTGSQAGRNYLSQFVGQRLAPVAGGQFGAQYGSQP